MYLLYMGKKKDDADRIDGDNDEDIGESRPRPQFPMSDSGSGQQWSVFYK